MAQKTSKGTAPDKNALRRIKKQLHNAANFVRARETTEAISRVTFNELIATARKELVGDKSVNLRSTIKFFSEGKEVEVGVKRTKVHGRIILTQLDRINALENTIKQLVAGVKKIDPEALAKTLNEQKQQDTR